MTAAVLLLLAAAAAQSAVHSDPRQFLLLDDSNHEEITSKSDPKVLFFHAAADCPNCPKVMAAVASLAPEHAKHNVPTFLVDCAAAPQTCRKRLNNRKPPAVAVQIASKFVFYYGDYSAKSLGEFVGRRLLTDHLRPFSAEEYNKQVDRTRKEQHTIVVYRGDNVFVRESLLRPLSQLEPEDVYLLCPPSGPCDRLFPDSRQDLLLIKADRKSFLVGEDLQSFEQLHSAFYGFKNVFLIPFGVEFRKKVMEEMSPTVVLYVPKKAPREAAEADVEVFKATIVEFSKRCYAAIVREAGMDREQRELLRALKDELGLDDLPRMMVLEADMDTMRLQKYTYPFLDVKAGEMTEFLNDWMANKLEPSKRSERLSPGKRYQGVEVLSHDLFKKRVFVAGQESAVLIHKGLQSDRKSGRFFEMLKGLKDASEGQGLSYFVVDAELNDVPVFVSKVPSIAIFTKDSWDNPLVFDVEDARKLREVVAKRKELVIDLSGEAAQGDGEL